VKEVKGIYVFSYFSIRGILVFFVAYGGAGRVYWGA